MMRSALASLSAMSARSTSGERAEMRGRRQARRLRRVELREARAPHALGGSDAAEGLGGRERLCYRRPTAPLGSCVTEANVAVLSVGALFHGRYRVVRSIGAGAWDPCMRSSM